jgi:hypothetical protein
MSYPATLSDLQTYISGKINDPTNTRYSLTTINSELDTVQDRWNLEAHIVRDSVTLTTVAGTSTYALSGLTGTPIKFLRVTHKGINLQKRSKQYFDMFTSYDWTADNGTPNDYYIDINTSTPLIGVRPNPQGNDAGANLKIEYVKRHTSMSAASDTPFMNGSSANTLVAPYFYGVGLEAAANLLDPDPTPETVQKASLFRAQAERVLSIVMQIYTDLDSDEPLRIQGGRNWIY